MTTQSLARRKRLDRDEWIKAALDVMTEGSVEQVGVEPLARKLGVTKGSFYWHFKDRDALLRAVLDYWREVATRDIMLYVEERGGSPADRLRRVCKIGVDMSPSNPLSRLEAAIRDWARRDPGARAAQVEDDRDRTAYLEKLFVEAGLKPEEARLRAELAFAFVLGERHIMRDEPKRATKDRWDQMLTILIDDVIAANAR